MLRNEQNFKCRRIINLRCEPFFKWFSFSRNKKSNIESKKELSPPSPGNTLSLFAKQLKFSSVRNLRNFSRKRNLEFQKREFFLFAVEKEEKKWKKIGKLLLNSGVTEISKEKSKMFDCVFTSGRLKNLFFCYQVDGKFYLRRNWCKMNRELSETSVHARTASRIFQRWSVS